MCIGGFFDRGAHGMDGMGNAVNAGEMQGGEA